MSKLATEHGLRPARILFVITDLNVGGAEKYVLQLATRLDRRGWSPTVCSLVPPGVIAEQLAARGVPVHSLNVRHAWDAPVAVARLARLVQRVRPHIVHTVLFHANIVGRIASRLAGVGRVVSSIRVAERRSRHHLILESLTCRLSRQVLCVSDAVARFTHRHSHVPTARLVVIPNGVETETAARDDARSTVSDLPAAPVTALFVGRLDPQKGVDVLLHALALAARENPRLHLLVAGAGPDDASLRALAGRLGVTQYVTFLGFRSDVSQLMRRADFLVLASRWEGMPNVVLEAMAAGLPVIATRTEGTTEVVRHDGTGSLVPIDDPAALAREMLRLARDPALRTVWGDRGRELVGERFSLAAMIARHERIYESILRERA